MTGIEYFTSTHQELKKKLASVELPIGSETSICWKIGEPFNITGPTVKNYLNGKIKDGVLAQALFMEFKRLKYVRNN